LERLLDVAPVAIVKRGADGATVLARGAAGPAVRLEVPTRPVAASDTTGAGDAFDAGFLAAWLALDRASGPAALRRAAVAGNLAAARQIAARRPELALG
ncbi:MAG: PfkB family carbohydrate kinase, partial [Chloroflexota bacterium]